MLLRKLLTKLEIGENENPRTATLKALGEGALDGLAILGAAVIVLGTAKMIIK